MTSKWRQPQNEDNLNNEDNLKNDDDLKNEDNIKKNIILFLFVLS